MLACGCPSVKCMRISLRERVVSLVLGVVFFLGILAFLATPLVFSQPAWPTPPPAPRSPPPEIIPFDQITPVPVVTVSGAASAVIHPLLAGSVPRIPPLKDVTFESPDGIRLISEAGSLQRTVQLLYAPVPLDDAPQAGPNQQLLRTFDLSTFDDQASRVSPSLERSWLLEVPLEGLDLGSNHPTRLLLALYDPETQRWAPLVTSYFSKRGLLLARLLDVGLFAILY